MTSPRGETPPWKCWVCDAIVDDPDSHDGSPLGGAFSAPKCEACIAQRATSPQHAARFANDEARWIAEGDLGYGQFYDVDGNHRHGGVPVTVHEDGRYVLYPAWRDSKAGRHALKVFRLWLNHSRAGWFAERRPIPPMPSLARRIWWRVAPYVARPRVSGILMVGSVRKRIRLY